MRPYALGLLAAISACDALTAGESEMRTFRSYVAWKKSRRILRIPAGDPIPAIDEGANGWTPRDIEDVSVYVNPQLDITVDGSNRVASILDQITDEALTNPFTNPDPLEEVEIGDNTPWLPTYDAIAFGQGRPGLVHAPNRIGVKAQYLRLSTKRQLASGMSFFWVSRHTEARTTNNHGQNIAMTVSSESSHDTFFLAGFRAGELAASYFTGSFQKIYAGSGYNDDVPRLYGWTFSTGGELKAYVNGAQVGSTVTGADYPPSTYATWCAIGSGYASDAPPDIYGGDDGFGGKTGPQIVVNGVISAEDLALLYAWAQSTGWVP